MVVLTATLIAALPGAAVSARAATVVAAASDPPVILLFESMDPGTTEAKTAALTTDAPDGAALVRAVVVGTGELADHLTTLVEACSVPWVGPDCSAGGAVLLAGPVAPGVDERHDIPVPESGVAYIRVELTLDGAAPANASSTVRYRLDLVAPDAPVPPDPGTPSTGPVPGTPGSAPPLAVTGAEAAALGAAALALVALGLTLRTWVRERRRTGATGWVW